MSERSLLSCRMQSFSVAVAVCLLTGLSEVLAGDEGNQTQLTEDLADISQEQDPFHNQGLETAAVLTSNTEGGCEPPIYTVLRQLGALEERLTATGRALEETNKKLEASERRVSALNRTVSELSTVDQGRPQVAFSAALPVDGTIGPLNVLYPLVYRHVLSNIGGHYSVHTGYFTAPVQGVYYFTFTSFCWVGKKNHCGGSLYKNENRIVSWYVGHNDHPSTGSNSAILQLQVGDKVNVRLWSNQMINDNGNNHSTFSGFLLLSA